MSDYYDNAREGLDVTERRTAIYEALAGREGASSLDRTAPTDVQSMLMARFSHTYRGQQRVHTRAAAAELGVSQRTVQRWLKDQRMPVGDQYRRLALSVRQQATRKAGRQQAVAAARERLAPMMERRGGIQLNVHGYQGAPPGPGMKDYRRSRNAFLDMSAAQTDEMFDAYAQGGDEGLQLWLNEVYGAEGGYLADWNISSIDRLQFGESNKTFRD